MSVWKTNTGRQEDKLSDVLKKTVLEKFASYEPTLVELGIAASKATLSKMVSAANDPECTRKTMNELCEEFVMRLLDETRERHFFS
jgi:hypothetical protein